MSDIDHNVMPHLTEAIDELTLPRTHTETIRVHAPSGWTNMKHHTRVESLLDQLRSTVTPGGAGDSGRGVPASRPTARLDAIDVLLRIEHASTHWLTHNCQRPLRPTLEQNLRALVGAAPFLDDLARWELAREARRWATWARVTTGWEVPPFRPDNTCPLCNKRGGLRVRAGDGVTSTEASGMCVDCGEAWDPSTIGLLAEHIITENDSDPCPTLAAAVDQHFPRRGPCLLCGIPGEDARHRVIDAIAGRYHAGDSEEEIAADYSLAVEAVMVAVQATLGQQVRDDAENDDTPISRTG